MVCEFFAHGITVSTVEIRMDIDTIVFLLRNFRMIGVVLKVEFLNSSREVFDFLNILFVVQVDIDVVAKVSQHENSRIYYNINFKKSSSMKEEFRR